MIAANKPICPGVSTTIGRCGKAYGRCNAAVDKRRAFCNLDINWCYDRPGLSKKKGTDQFDFEPKSCKVQGGIQVLYRGSSINISWFYNMLG